MRNSSWPGRRERVKKQSRKDWLGCGDKNKKTLSWPLHSVRLTCQTLKKEALGLHSVEEKNLGTKLL